MVDISINSLRQNARQVVDDARNQYISPYEEWTSDELRELLVQYKIPIRDSANATHETLVRICDNVFGADIAESEKECRGRRYSVEDVVRMDASVRVIQKAFLKRQSLKKKQRRIQKQRQYYNEDCDDEYETINLVSDDNDCEEGGGSCSHEQYEYFVDDHDRGDGEEYYKNSFRRQSMLRRINEQGDDYDQEIEVEWRKPSWKFAKKFEAMNRPHRPGRQLAKYDWNRVTLGRHCYAGGCGEQLDLWNEGRTSEFSQFGSGITNYFKVSALFMCCDSHDVSVVRVSNDVHLLLNHS